MEVSSAGVSALNLNSEARSLGELAQHHGVLSLEFLASPRLDDGLQMHEGDHLEVSSIYDRCDLAVSAKRGDASTAASRLGQPHKALRRLRQASSARKLSGASGDTVSQTLNCIPAGALDFSAVGTLAGAGRPGFRDGDLRTSLFDEPGDLCALPCGDVIIADQRNSCLRVLHTDYTISDFSMDLGRGAGPVVVPRDYTGNKDPDEGAVSRQRRSKAPTRVMHGSVRTLDSCSLLRPRAPVLLDNGKALAVCDSGHHKVRLLQLHREQADGRDRARTDMAVGCTALHAHDSVLAGSGRRGHRDGPAERAQFDSPGGLCVLPDGSILVADTGNNCIRRISGKTGRSGLYVSTVAGQPSGSAANSSSSANQHRDAVTAKVTATASKRYRGYGNSAFEARVLDDDYETPRALRSLHAVDMTEGGSEGTHQSTHQHSDLFRTAEEHGPADTSTRTGGGWAHKDRWKDGAGADAAFWHPTCIVYDHVSGLVIVSDSGNSCIRAMLPPRDIRGAMKNLTRQGDSPVRVSPGVATRQYEVTTVAGRPGEPGYLDGAGPAAQFGRPSQLAVAADGSILVADSRNQCIRAIVQTSESAFGQVITVCGAPSTGHYQKRCRDGVLKHARLARPVGMCAIPGSDGCLLVTDAAINHLRVVFTRKAAHDPPRCIARAIPAGLATSVATYTWARKARASRPPEGVLAQLELMSRGSSRKTGSAVAALLGASRHGGSTFYYGSQSFRRGGGAGLSKSFAGHDPGMEIAFGLDSTETGLDLIDRLDVSVAAMRKPMHVTPSHARAHVRSWTTNQQAPRYHAQSHRGAPAAIYSASVLDRLGVLRPSDVLATPGQPRVVMSSHARAAYGGHGSDYTPRSSPLDAEVQTPGGRVAYRPGVQLNSMERRGIGHGGEAKYSHADMLLTSPGLAERLSTSRDHHVAFGRTADGAHPVLAIESPVRKRPHRAATPNAFKQSQPDTSNRVVRRSRQVGDLLNDASRNFVEANSPVARLISQAYRSKPLPPRSSPEGAGGSHQRGMKASILRLDGEIEEYHELRKEAVRAAERATSVVASFERPPPDRDEPGADQIRRTRENMRRSTPEGAYDDEYGGACSGSLNVEAHTIALPPTGNDSPQKEDMNSCAIDAFATDTDSPSRIVEDALSEVMLGFGQGGTVGGKAANEALHHLHLRIEYLNLGDTAKAESLQLVNRCFTMMHADKGTGRGVAPSLAGATSILRHAAILDAHVNKAVSIGQHGSNSGIHNHAEGPQHATAGLSSRKPDAKYVDDRPPSASGSGVIPQYASKAQDYPRSRPPPNTGYASGQSSELSWSLASDTADADRLADPLTPASGLPRYRQPTVSAVLRARSSGVRLRPTSLSYGWRARNRGAASWVEASELEVERLVGPGAVEASTGHSPEALHRLAVRRLEATRGPRGEAMQDVMRSIALGRSAGRYTRRSADLSKNLGRRPPVNSSGMGSSYLRIQPAVHARQAFLNDSPRASSQSHHIPLHLRYDEQGAWIQHPPLDMDVKTTPAFATQRGGGEVGIADFVESRQSDIGGVPGGREDRASRHRFVYSHAAVQAHHPAMRLRSGEQEFRRSVGAAAATAAGSKNPVSPLRQIETLRAFSVEAPAEVSRGRRVTFAR